MVDYLYPLSTHIVAGVSMVTQLRVERRAFPSAGGGAWDSGSYTQTSVDLELS